MAQNSYGYTIVTSKGDYNLTTPNHHSSYRSVEDWIKAHQATIDLAFRMGTTVVEVYLSHKRAGQRIK